MDSDEEPCAKRKKPKEKEEEIDLDTIEKIINEISKDERVEPKKD